MKKFMLIGLFGLLSTASAYTQLSDIQLIEQTILVFAEAGDNQDIKAFEKVLDENYRVVMNRLFGGDKVAVLSRDVYLKKIKNKEFGGDKREVSILNITVNGTTATAKVSLKGTKMTFISLLTLVKNEAGEWSLISDVPVID
jgi:hypothetical protein